MKEHNGCLMADAVRRPNPSEQPAFKTIYGMIDGLDGGMLGVHKMVKEHLQQCYYKQAQFDALNSDKYVR